MFSVAIVCKSSFEVLFEHNFNSFIKTKRKKNSFDNFYLMQIVSPLILSKKILKIQAHRDISGLTFKKISRLSQLYFYRRIEIELEAGSSSVLDHADQLCTKSFRI